VVAVELELQAQPIGIAELEQLVDGGVKGDVPWAIGGNEVPNLGEFGDVATLHEIWLKLNYDF
jgi:hypothetical protein